MTMVYTEVVVALTTLLTSLAHVVTSDRLPLHIQESSSRQVYNLTNLVYQYYLVCGSEYICEKHHFAFIERLPMTSVPGLCPACSCEKQCVQNKDCCPDVAFLFPDPLCRNNSIVQQDLSGNKQNYVITECHDKATTELKEKCSMNYTTGELIQHPPVTSSNYAYTFRNKFCAECNGVYDYTSWGIDITCHEFLEFNFLSSYKDIADHAKQQQCNLVYEADMPSNLHPCYMSLTYVEPMYLVPGGCNVTGTWTYYDADIAAACSSGYSLNHMGYPNIFCALCNPPLIQSDPIDVCNASGIWSPYDPSLETACRKMEATTITIPYKNVFCFLCNRNNSNGFQFYEAQADFLSTGFPGMYEYTFYLENYNTDAYSSILLENNQTVVMDNPHDMNMVADDIQLNTTKLLMYHYAVFGWKTYCSADFTPYFFEDTLCSCNPRRLFADGPNYCCVDVVLDSPTSCFSDVLSDSDVPTREWSYGAIDKCNSLVADGILKSRCEDKEAVDIFSMIPVQSGNMIYKNFDCFICQNPSVDFQMIPPYRAYGIVIECQSGEIGSHFVRILDAVEAARRKKCIIRVRPRVEFDTSVLMSKAYCDYTDLIGRCNTTGSWTSFDQDILRACEGSKFLPPYQNYKNVYCYLCNSAVPSSESSNGTVIDSCLIAADQQHYGENITRACATLPEVPGFGPFRNIFCFTCSIENATIMKPDVWSPGLFRGVFIGSQDRQWHGHAIVGNDIRDLFSVVKMEVMEMDISDSEIYDEVHKKVRRLTCYPGKMLSESTCQPLLKVTSNLRYTLAFSMEGTTSLELLDDHVHGTKVNQLLSEVNANIELEIVDRVRELMTFDSSYIMVNLSCTSTRTGSVGLRILVHKTFLIVSDVDRLLVEEKLLNMTKAYYNVGNTTFLSSSASVDALMLPSLVHKYSFVPRCYMADMYTPHISSYAMERSSIVSNLLLCRHVALDTNEFTIDENVLTLTVKNSGRAFHQMEYMLVDDQARICLDVYISKHEEDKKTPEINIALGVTTLVCNSISLVCLFLTFITYCLFPVLRSVPGINNMNLVFIMFFAQLLFQVGFSSTSLPKVCVTTGVFIHFFWLSMFACMHVCSFHMYSVFTSKLRGSGETGRWKKIIMMYMLYSHGVPAVLILINIIVVYTTSEDSSIGYGHTRCFVTNVASFYTTFLAPVLIICLSNIYFFVRTTIKIKNTPKIESNLETRNQFVIYVKLFSLTGITWILLIIDTILPVTVFSFLVVFATACQGLFVLVSFILNRRVYNLYCALFGRRKPDTSKQTSSATRSLLTNSTTV